MKKLVLVTMVLLGGLTVQASEKVDILLSNTRTAYINKVKSNTLGLSVSEPGKDFSKICGIELRVDSNSQGITIQNFLDAISITAVHSEKVAVKVSNALTIDLDVAELNGSFGAWFTLETKDGSTIKQTIERTLGEGRSVLAVTRTCQ